MISEQAMTNQKNQRTSTITAYYDAVEQVIIAMSERFADPLSLQDMADMASLSPHHFNRVFCKITGITPGRFLCAMRLKAAMHLLLTTQRSVTDICFDVGYNSLGTFTTRFTQLIGLSPTQLRNLVDQAPPMLELLATYSQRLSCARPPDCGVRGRIRASDFSSGAIFVGLFKTAIPQERPVGCTLLTRPATYSISSVPEGRYYILAIAFPKSDDFLSYLAPDRTTLKVGRGQSRLVVCGNRMVHYPDIVLRSTKVTDPPILSAVPLFLMEVCADFGMILA